MLIGKIKKIGSLQNSYNPGEKTFPVIIELQNGKCFPTWLVPKDKNGNPYRNYQRWELYLKVGNVLGGLRMYGNKLIDADSSPVLLPPEKFRKENPNQESLFDLSNPKDFCKAIL